jgi:Ca2+-binding RTX toxin-like protein
MKNFQTPIQPVKPAYVLINGTSNDDVLYGTDSADEIHGGDGNDTLSGGAGDDKIDGGIGNDTIYGGAGKDQNIGGDDRDFDTVTYANSPTSGVLVMLNGPSQDSTSLGMDGGYGGYAEGDTYIGIERIIGTRFTDYLQNNGTDSATLEGGDGSDTLISMSGDDTLIGGPGVDLLYGNGGHNELTGGTGSDYFYFTLGNDGISDITDFQVGVDHIVIQNSSWDQAFGKDHVLLSGDNVYANQYSTVGVGYSDRLFWDTDDHQLWQITYVEGTAQPMLMASFDSQVQLHASDFWA